MTRNLKLFAIFSFLWSIPYFVFLNWTLYSPDKRGVLMLPIYFIFGAGFSIAGHRLGKREDQHKVRYSFGIRYATTAVIVSTLVGVAWVAFWQPHHIWWLVSYIANVVVFLIIVYVYSRQSIKGIPKKELFK